MTVPLVSLRFKAHQRQRTHDLFVPQCNISKKDLEIAQHMMVKHLIEIIANNLLFYYANVSKYINYNAQTRHCIDMPRHNVLLRYYRRNDRVLIPIKLFQVSSTLLLR